MILIADSGASKTDWACISKKSQDFFRFSSYGYNPNYISGDSIVSDIKRNVPEGLDSGNVKEIYYYGAGVTPLQYPFVEKTLLEVFKNAEKIFIAMDTLASCRALLMDKPGFAAILGTGANSCLYDGKKEIMNVDSCGFILGDEGSGAYLGKRLITDYIRRNMPDKVYKIVSKELCADNDKLLDIIYTKPFPNRFCAGYAKFILAQCEFDPYFRELASDSFRQFFDKIVTHYPEYKKYTFNAVGSIAYYYRKFIEPVVDEYGMKTGRILIAPMDGLIEYHRKY